MLNVSDYLFNLFLFLLSVLLSMSLSVRPSVSVSVCLCLSLSVSVCLCLSLSVSPSLSMMPNPGGLRNILPDPQSADWRLACSPRICSVVMTAPLDPKFQKAGDHPNFRKNALGVRRPFSELSESSGVLSEQLSEFEILFSEYEIPFSEWPLTT